MFGLFFWYDQHISKYNFKMKNNLLYIYIYIYLKIKISTIMKRFKVVLLAILMLILGSEPFNAKAMWPIVPSICPPIYYWAVPGTLLTNLDDWQEGEPILVACDTEENLNWICCIPSNPF